MSIISSSTKIKVSSTLDKSTPRKSLVDRDPGTCWTSTQGLPQWIQLSFATPVIPNRLYITFQGGFVGTRVSIQIAKDAASLSGTARSDPAWRLLKYVYPEDVNRKQQFDLGDCSQSSPTNVNEDETLASDSVDHIKLIFEQSSDFFGRVTVYDLDVQGETVPIT
ncbi:hypothetical protein FRC19_006936 [Serendipita sp. 401]|nr:hypothetical protein FRC19_006936 [Serendipita sp. 401]